MQTQELLVNVVEEDRAVLEKRDLEDEVRPETLARHDHPLPLPD